jgi:outer membrane protein TolC
LLGNCIDGKRGLASFVIPGVLVIVALVRAPMLSAAETPPIPVPLTLEFALAAGTDSSNPTLLAAQAETRAAEAELADAESSYDLESSLSLTAGWVEPNTLAYDQSHNDSLARISVRKVLYDFGVTGDRIDSAESLVRAGELEYRVTRQHQIITVARHYFEVLLADLKYTWDNENLAMEYVQYDRIRERHALKQVSDVDLARSENAYQVALTRRTASETAQRTSRALLAVVINRPGELSAELAEPALSLAGRVLPELDELVAEALNGNIAIQVGRKRESAARLSLDSAKQRIRPTLDATLELSEYSRNLPGNDDARARLNLVIPLNESGAQRSDIASKRAQWLKLSAQVLQLEAEARRQLAAVWQRLLQLQSHRRELDVANKRAELELDRARGEYELEMKTSLGNAMVNISKVRYERAKNEYESALAWMDLYLLLGRNPEDVLQGEGG